MKRLLPILILVAGLVACDTPPPVATPGPVSGSPTVVVYGDSLTPIPDYRAQAGASGYRFYHEALGGSHLCTTRDDGRENWEHVDEAIGRFDYVVMQYQGWQNYTVACGGPADAYVRTHNDPDPGKPWRVYWEHFALRARASGAHIFIAETPGAPADFNAWRIPMGIADTAARTMADRYPDVLTFVPSRRYFTTADGAWTERSGCLTQEASWCASDGTVRLRGDDRIHYACPGTQGLVCSTRSPAGTRHALVMFTAINHRAA